MSWIVIAVLIALAGAAFASMIDRARKGTLHTKHRWTKDDKA